MKFKTIIISFTILLLITGCTNGNSDNQTSNSQTEEETIEKPQKNTQDKDSLVVFTDKDLREIEEVNQNIYSMLSSLSGMADDTGRDKIKISNSILEGYETKIGDYLHDDLEYSVRFITIDSGYIDDPNECFGISTNAMNKDCEFYFNFDETGVNGETQIKKQEHLGVSFSYQELVTRNGDINFETIFVKTSDNELKLVSGPFIYSSGFDLEGESKVVTNILETDSNEPISKREGEIIDSLNIQ